MAAFITLYFINFLRTVAIIAIIYFGVRLISRYLFPMLINKGMKNMQQKMQDPQRGHRQPRRPEGEVTIEGKPNQSKGNKSSEGEYIDFEEVE